MKPKELLISGARELNVLLTPEQVELLFMYVTELKKWNRKINLTAITDDHDVVVKHLLDSLSYRKGFVPEPGARLLDMGSGAGFPAIPVKIACPEIAVTLVESVKKKASFLRHIVRSLPLTQTNVVDARTGELPAIYENTYSVVTARAFAGMADALREGGRFLGTGGVMVLSRGPGETVGDQDINKAGMMLEKKIDLRLPHSDYERAIWVFKKKVT